jgi:hypothetical protein
MVFWTKGNSTQPPTSTTPTTTGKISQSTLLVAIPFFQSCPQQMFRGHPYISMANTSTTDTSTDQTFYVSIILQK